MSTLVALQCPQCNGTGYFEVGDPANPGNRAWVECSAGQFRPYCQKGKVVFIELSEGDASDTVTVEVSRRFAEHFKLA